jgi:hypothetical protein
MLTRYASVLQVREIQGGPRNCHRSGAGREAPGKTSHYSREAVLGAPDQVERHETPDPVRSNALNVRFHGVRQDERGDCGPEDCEHRSGMNPAFLAL